PELVTREEAGEHGPGAGEALLEPGPRRPLPDHREARLALQRAHRLGEDVDALLERDAPGVDDQRTLDVAAGEAVAHLVAAAARVERLGVDRLRPQAHPPDPQPAGELDHLRA